MDIFAITEECRIDSAEHFSHSRYLKGLIIAIICVSKWRVIWLAGRLGHGGRGT